jgi:hypothetical protein
LSEREVSSAGALFMMCQWRSVPYRGTLHFLFFFFLLSFVIYDMACVSSQLCCLHRGAWAHTNRKRIKGTRKCIGYIRYVNTKASIVSSLKTRGETKGNEDFFRRNLNYDLPGTKIQLNAMTSLRPVPMPNAPDAPIASTRTRPVKPPRKREETAMILWSRLTTNEG